MDANLYLYSTSGCHLCEQAYAQLQHLNIEEKVQVVDIAFDDELFDRYGTQIPVLALQQSTQVIALFWPFTCEELTQWLKNNGINYNS